MPGWEQGKEWTGNKSTNEHITRKTSNMIFRLVPIKLVVVSVWLFWFFCTFYVAAPREIILLSTNFTVDFVMSQRHTQAHAFRIWCNSRFYCGKTKWNSWISRFEAAVFQLFGYVCVEFFSITFFMAIFLQLQLD